MDDNMTPDAALAAADSARSAAAARVVPRWLLGVASWCRLRLLAA